MATDWIWEVQKFVNRILEFLTGLETIDCVDIKKTSLYMAGQGGFFMVDLLSFFMKSNWESCCNGTIV